jgi:dihydroorotate dehydrogenase
MERVIISAPFGNYLTFPGCTSTIGTFTAEQRRGRWWKVATTLRYNWRQQSWINKLGLRNPGIASLYWGEASEGLVSIHGFTMAEWMKLAVGCVAIAVSGIELNLSCPNVADSLLPLATVDYLRQNTAGNCQLVAKLAPVDWMKFAVPLKRAGVHTFHLCNTIPTPGGGISGKPLKQYSLWAIREFRQKWGSDVTLIGGGGITNEDDVRDYKQAGADHIALGSCLFNPMNWFKVKRFVEIMNDRA